jgi:hypothetical protein
MTESGDWRIRMVKLLPQLKKLDGAPIEVCSSFGLVENRIYCYSFCVCLSCRIRSAKLQRRCNDRNVVFEQNQEARGLRKCRRRN